MRVWEDKCPRGACETYDMGSIEDGNYIANQDQASALVDWLAFGKLG